MNLKVKGKHILLSFVLLLTGFILAFSYMTANESRSELPPGYERQWKYEDELRQQINEEKTAISMLQEELHTYQSEVTELEEKLTEVDAEREAIAQNLFEELESLRKMTGKVKVEGPGIEITLEDASYLPEGANPNDYIVHDAHIQLVVHELFVAGAEAVAINGFRLSAHSFIQCTGPVVQVDGHISPAPFTITAIGDSESLESALTLYGGVRDRLLNDEINVRIQKKNTIVLDPLFVERG